MHTQQLTLALDAGLWLDFVTRCQVRRVRPEAELEALLAQRLDQWTQAETQDQDVWGVRGGD